MDERAIGASTQLDVEAVVGARYSEAARAREGELCCPVDYDARYLEVIPPRILERDYGCGDPSRYARPGDTVLDLGSGGGKICFIASQIVGPTGAVIGVDLNEEMLTLARGAAPEVAARLGYGNTRFLRARIQALPLPSASVDLVISNCVLNLVNDADRDALIHELYRVLRSGGRIAISDIVADRPVPDALRADPELWSGCVAGAFVEMELLDKLQNAGFAGVAVDKREPKPFRSVTVVGGNDKPPLRGGTGQSGTCC